ncbi:uncharacterized protein NFIA_038390 [Aspergillus fischeri NRRL 181]|uniref:Uncharacterized protein n=1 Tax=Neosartorya fischeri (strain ATCC 1020 / DSM 3700 / CBS 544.65 / FGSC A1164 / JCM 1740 / NRRL 181 / WB 181) TaxID=331117 RepID=A1CZU5_NEOFI|nr:conserved hypothetical protein [Aspergillus fischeri NRRL 181]EAW24265.1 conserved hypothetical protein [Aspergillus fischeri NRRL 181]
MTDYRLPIHQAPSRKPVPGMHRGYPFQSYEPHQQQPPHHYRAQQQQHDHHQQQEVSPHPSVSSASRNRTSSSHVSPYGAHQQQYAGAPSPHYTMTSHVSHPSRRLSSATTSTSSTGNNFSSDIRRSTSSRSTNAQVGYVALMRRQKATVWCDRAQPEDPRLRAQKLADKKRAYLEVHGAGAGRTGTLGSGKNKHGNKGVTEFSASTLVGATVPVRLSANEVGDGDEDGHSDNGFPHRRTGSGRSSLGSNYRYPSSYQRPSQGTPGSNTPPNEKADLPEVTENSPAERHEEEKASSTKDDSATSHSKTSEQEDSFGSVGDMAAPSAATTAAEKARKADELRRRGSVDERTTTMTNVRLFVANPDLSD